MKVPLKLQSALHGRERDESSCFGPCRSTGLENRLPVNSLTTCVCCRTGSLELRREQPERIVWLIEFRQKFGGDTTGAKVRLVLMLAVFLVNSVCGCLGPEKLIDRDKAGWRGADFRCIIEARFNCSHNRDQWDRFDCEERFRMECMEKAGYVKTE
jgi:hypothetical protein